MNMFFKHTTTRWLLSMALAWGCTLALGQGKADNAPITMNFVNAEIEAVAKTLAGLTRRTLVVDPRVKGTINLSTEKPVTPQVAWNQFLAVLRLQGLRLWRRRACTKWCLKLKPSRKGAGMQIGRAHV